MALSDIDRSLLQRCLTRKPRAWEDFVDRFMGLVIHVVNHSAQCRSLRLAAEDREDLVAQVFLTVVKDDLAVLRNFRGDSSLATYLTVVARRVVVRDLLKQPASVPMHGSGGMGVGGISPAENRSDDREEIERLLEELDGAEAEIVRMYHLEGKSYHEISTAVGMPENSVGPTLSRARNKMRRAATEPTAD
ncbi:MAG TPA: sigma-70 family RNA polymerase sigma factor [Pirellulales bacterium]|jgi:RNA polymerase sigma-70 factor (ECF subfamily)|nr:sigma-70 family RNA polymerase sigma factor [Pirellulales bacterium]